jgi:hypothetical protein
MIVRDIFFVVYNIMSGYSPFTLWVVPLIVVMPTTSLKVTVSPVSRPCLVFSIHVTTPGLPWGMGMKISEWESGTSRIWTISVVLIHSKHVQIYILYHQLLATSSRLHVPLQISWYYRIPYLGDVSNKAFDWFLSIIVTNGELIAKVTEHRGEDTSHAAADELTQQCIR